MNPREHGFVSRIQTLIPANIYEFTVHVHELANDLNSDACVMKLHKLLPAEMFFVAQVTLKINEITFRPP